MLQRHLVAQCACSGVASAAARLPRAWSVDSSGYSAARHPSHRVPGKGQQTQFAI